MRAWIWPEGAGGGCQEVDVPTSLAQEARHRRRLLEEQVAERHHGALEEFCTGTISDRTLAEGLRDITLRGDGRSEEHTSELQSRQYLVCRLLLEKKKYQRCTHHTMC